jgi:hypothetical protein
MVEANDWNLEEEEDQDWDMGGGDEGWDEPSLDHKKSSNFGVYQTDKWSRPYKLIGKDEIIKR